MQNGGIRNPWLTVREEPTTRPFVLIRAYSIRLLGLNGVGPEERQKGKGHD